MFGGERWPWAKTARARMYAGDPSPIFSVPYGESVTDCKTDSFLHPEEYRVLHAYPLSTLSANSVLAIV